MNVHRSALNGLVCPTLYSHLEGIGCRVWGVGFSEKKKSGGQQSDFSSNEDWAGGEREKMRGRERNRERDRPREREREPTKHTHLLRERGGRAVCQRWGRLRWIFTSAKVPIDCFWRHKIDYTNALPSLAELNCAVNFDAQT